MRGDRPLAVGSESVAASDSSITRSAIGTRHRPVVERDTVATSRRPSALAASDVYRLDAGEHAVRNATLDVHGMNPGPISLFIRRQIQQHPVVEHVGKVTRAS